MRAIRKQKRLSLQEVEATSHGEFRASVVGAYERGERAISVPRLQRLAELYMVPVDQLLPNGLVAEEPVICLSEASAAGGVPPDRAVVLDLTALNGLVDAEAEAVRRYVSMIQVERQDFNGRQLSIRRDDLRTIGAMMGVSAEVVPSWLNELGLVYDAGQLAQT